MDGISIKNLARNIGTPTRQLINQLREAGVAVNSEDDLVTGEEKLRLLQQFRFKEGERGVTDEVTLDRLCAAADLQTLDGLLTQAMAERKIQGLIKERNLETVIGRVLELAEDVEQELLAAAILGRLAAVARGRERVIFDRASDVVTVEPASIETLADGDAKQYAAQMLAHVSTSWADVYSYREALMIDSADNARRELLAANLAREGSIAAWLHGITSHVDVLRRIENVETRLKRVRRIVVKMGDIVQQWRGEVGSDVGARLADCLKSFLVGKLGDVDRDVLYEAIDSLLAILRRVVELRFSTALYATTFDLLSQGKKRLGPGAWARFVEQSTVIPAIRVALLESALVLARQNKQDRQIMACLTACYASSPQVATAIRRHFQEARDLDPEVAEWWRTARGESEAQRYVEHKVGNNEDSQIGALLIEVDSNREAMEKVGRAVVPLLEISEPVLASTVKKAVDGYQGIAQIARRLARMRKLTKTDLKGERLEYNPLQHEMLGGHKAGVRRVKVVRDGIKKEFSGKIRTLVKPWVEPDQE
jgi:hypothetical protein